MKKLLLQLLFSLSVVTVSVTVATMESSRESKRLYDRYISPQVRVYMANPAKNTVFTGYFGMDSVQVAGQNALRLIPSGGGKYTLVIEIPDQTEDLDVNPSGLSALYNSGTPKIISNGGNPYLLKSNGDSLKYIFYKIQQPSYNGGAFADAIGAYCTAIMAQAGASIDTTKDANGFYEHIAIASCRRGSDAIVNALLYTASGGCGSGSEPGWVFRHIKKFNFGQVDNVCNLSTLPPASFNNHNTKIIRYFKKVGDFTSETQVRDSIAKYSPGAYQKLRSFSGTNQTVFDTMFSTLGVDSSHNIYLEAAGDAGTPPIATVQINYSVDEVPTYSNQNKGKSIRLHDTTGGPVDPLNDVTDFPNPQNLRSGMPENFYGQYYPEPANGHPGNRGLGLWFDMTKAKDYTDTTHKVFVTSVWGYSNTQDAGDTMYFYNFDDIFRLPAGQRWAPMARPDSLMTPIGYLITVGGNVGAWQSFTINRPIRNLYARLVKKQRFFGMTGYLTTAVYEKIIIYGSYQYDPATVPAIPSTYTGSLPPVRAYKNWVGTNLGQGIDPDYLAYDGNIRVYGGPQYWMKDTTLVQHTYHFDDFLDVGPAQYTIFNSRGQRMWWAITGSNAYVDRKFPGYALNTDDYPMEPGSPYSYNTAGEFSFYYAAKFGAVAISTSLTTKWDNNTANGLNTIHYWENGNELDRQNVMPQDYACRTMNEYDGYENRNGDGHYGVKNADPNFKIIQAATTYLDTFWIKNVARYCAIMRTDHANCVDEYNMHYYPRTGDHLGYDPKSGEQVGETSETPEKDSIYFTFTTVGRAVYNIPGVSNTSIINLTEYGYGNWGTAASTENEAAFPWDIGNTPSGFGYDSLQWKAMLMARFEIITAFTPFRASNEFFYHNSSFGDNSYLLFASYGRTSGRNITTFRPTVFYPWWWVRAWQYNTIANYKPDAYLEYGGFVGRHVQRWVNISDPTRVIYAIWLGTRDNTQLVNQVINDNIASGPVIMKTMSFTDSVGTTTVLTAANGRVTVPAVNAKILYLVARTGNANPSQPWHLFRKP